MARNADLLCRHGILIPLKVFELKLFDPLASVLVDLVEAVVVMMSDRLGFVACMGWAVRCMLIMLYQTELLTVFTLVFTKIVIQHQVLDALLFLTFRLLLVSHSNRKVGIGRKFQRPSLQTYQLLRFSP